MQIIGSRLAYDLMFAVIFDHDYEMVRKPNNRALIEDIKTSAVRVGVLVQIPWLKEYRQLNKWIFPTAIAARTKFIKFVNKMLQSNASKPPKHTDANRGNVFSILTNTRDPETGEALSPSEIGAESTTLLVAGK